MRTGLRRTVLLLLAGALFLPVAIVIILTMGRLLLALEDAAGAAVLKRIALAVGVVWVLVLVCLPIVLAVRTLTADDRSDGEEVRD